jgi:hypothetical protein
MEDYARAFAGQGRYSIMERSGVLEIAGVDTTGSIPCLSEAIYGQRRKSPFMQMVKQWLKRRMQRDVGGLIARSRHQTGAAGFDRTGGRRI